MKVKVTFTEELLGTASANPDLYEEFIGGKCADKEKVKAELEALETEELVEKSMTVFSRANGVPILWDYQIRGFIKEMIGILVEFEGITIGGKETTVINKKTKEETTVIKGGVKLSKWTFKRFVDNYIFVNPREIPLIIPKGGEIGTCSRPLRAATQQGERIALSYSETVPIGTSMEFEVTCLNPKLEPLVVKALDYGKHKGIGQWRNSGKGRFDWKELKDVKKVDVMKEIESLERARAQYKKDNATK